MVKRGIRTCYNYIFNLFLFTFPTQFPKSRECTFGLRTLQSVIKIATIKLYAKKQVYQLPGRSATRNSSVLNSETGSESKIHVSQPVPDFIKLLKQKKLLNNCLLSRNEQDTITNYTCVIVVWLVIYVTSEGAVSHNVLYYQQLPITRYQERFYADKYFEYCHSAAKW